MATIAALASGDRTLINVVALLLQVMTLPIQPPMIGIAAKAIAIITSEILFTCM